MVRPRRRLAAAAIVCGALTACATIADRSSWDDIHSTMVGKVDPAAVAIWSLGSRAMSEASGSRSTRMDTAGWTKLEASARDLAQSARLLADAPAIRVGDYQEAMDGFADKSEVQARIDAEPDKFRQLAREAAAHASRLAEAAQARNIPQTEALTKSLYDNCLACHSRFWKNP